MSVTVSHGKNRYPSPFGELQLDRRVDEITLMRLIDGMRDCGLEPRDVSSAQIHGANLITFEFYERDADDHFRFDDAHNLIRRTITAVRR